MSNPRPTLMNPIELSSLCDHQTILIKELEARLEREKQLALTLAKQIVRETIGMPCAAGCIGKPGCERAGQPRSEECVDILAESLTKLFR